MLLIFTIFRVHIRVMQKCNEAPVAYSLGVVAHNRPSSARTGGLGERGGGGGFCG